MDRTSKQAVPSSVQHVDRCISGDSSTAFALQARLKVRVLALGCHLWGTEGQGPT